MDSLQRLLEDHPFLAGLRPEHLHFLTRCAANLRCPPGDYLFREGEDASRLFMVRTGRVALELHVPGRGAVVVETIQAGDVLGWSFLFPPYRWNVDARVLEDTRLLGFDGACLRARLEEDPELGRALALRLLRCVGDRLERMRLQRLDLYAVNP